MSKYSVLLPRRKADYHRQFDYENTTDSIQKLVLPDKKWSCHSKSGRATLTDQTG